MDKMTNKQGRIIFTSKPQFWYYLLASLFPILFFLVDDSYNIFIDWTTDNLEWLGKMFAIFLFFGIPILLILLRREIILFEDRIEIYMPGIKRTKFFYLTDLIYWNIAEIYTYRVGSQTNLTLKFKRKRLDFNKIELASFEKLQKVLETKFHDKKR
jgi:hypothetical protein